jgi:hypothetical protein
MQIQLLPDGNVVVNYQGPVLAFTVNGMCETARQIMLAKLAQKANGPQVELARPGLRINP